ncbi:MAG: YdcF family protein [Methylocystis sp.]|nr:YdcF family protein [Methylocystis sp.]MBI3276047.1 YdcF family protein [Methylocystis sp.]
MFFILSKIFDFLLAPAHLGLFVTGLGTALCFTRFARGGRRLAALGAFALLIMSFSPLGYFIAMPLENRFPPAPDDIGPPDGIVVLGGSIDEDLSMLRGRTTFNDAAERLTAAVALARRFPVARLVFTGGAAKLGGSSFSEAEAAGRFWRDMGIGRERIICEARSRNTWENALFTRDLVKPQPGERWLLVTSAMHMPRSIGIFRQVGFPVIAYPVDYHTGGRWFEWSLPRKAPDALKIVDLAAHEWFGLLAYRLTGKTNALFPAP